MDTINKSKIELADYLIQAKYKAEHDIILFYHYEALKQNLFIDNGIYKINENKKIVF